jgi:signal transduction histidine kinase/CheY-like chemotaxis protein
MNGKQILVVAGNYDIVRQVQQALQGEGFLLQSAYTHFDAIYAVKNSRFDAVLIDAAMTDRSSGQPTLTAIFQHDTRPPLVVFSANGYTNDRLDQKLDKVITSLDKQSLIQSLNAANISASAARKLVAEAKSSPGEAELQTLLSLSKSLTEILDLGEVLNRVVESARRLTDADEGMILLPDDDGGQLYLRARVGIDVEAARNFRIKTSDTLAGQVFSSGLPTFIGAKGPQKVKTEYFANSLLYVPIISQGKPIGVLGVNNRKKEDSFNQQQQELLLSLASYAAIAIENARAHEDSLQRARELEILVDAGQVINSSISLDKALPNICEQLVRMLNVNVASIYEWNKEAQLLLLLARHESAIWRLKQGPPLEYTALRTVRAAIEQNRYCWITSQLAGPSTAEANYLKSVGANAMLVIPIHSQEKLLGVVQAFYNRIPAEAPTQENWSRARLNALEAAVNLIDSSNQGRVQNSLRLAENINRLINADWCRLALRVEETPTMRVQMAVGNGFWLEPPQVMIDLKRHEEVTAALETQLVTNANIEESTISKEAQTLMSATFSRSILALPLILRGNVQGLVVFGDTERSRIFSKREVDMGRAIVAQAATSLENARLMHDLELSFQELKDTQERLIQTARLSAMGELAAAVAHQVNNPLTTIVVDTELMLSDEPPTSRNYKSLEAVLRAGKRAAGVARRLLAIARPHDPEAPVSSVDVIDTVKGVITLTKSHLERSHVKLIANLPSEPMPSVYAVQGQIDDVWLNLILNAHDALVGRRDGCITVDTSYTPGSSFIEVTIADNGPGIPEHIMTEIFKPFFTTKPIGEGTGLGLHICRQVIERVNGSIEVDSSPNRGTRFVVRLPVQAE